MNENIAKKGHHLRVFLICFLAALVVFTFIFISIVPARMYGGFTKAIVRDGLGSGAGIPVNTLYTVPDIASPHNSAASFLATGNRDTLYTAGYLDLRNGPLVLRVPDMNDRYYSIQLNDPRNGRIIACIGRRKTGTDAGAFFITGPGWKGTVPAGMTGISSSNNNALLLGRVLVENNDEVPLVYELSKQITLGAYN